jgi:hypothetical protein
MSKMLKSVVIACTLAFMALPSAAQTGAATGTASVTLTPGVPTVTFTSGLDFGSVGLTGQALTDQPSSGNLVLQVNDNSGDAAGWTLGASAQDFTGPQAASGLVSTIPAANMSLAGSAATFSSPNDGYVAPSSNSDIVAMSSESQLFVSAGAGEGVGEQTVTIPGASVLLDVPYNAAAGTYSSTVTFTLTDI